MNDGGSHLSILSLASLSRPTLPREPSTKRLLWICLVGVLGLVMGQSLLHPVVVGWCRAEEALRLRDELEQLRYEHAALRAEIEYRKRDSGQVLTVAQTLLLIPPGGRLVELVPRQEPNLSSTPPRFSQRVKDWRRAGGNWVYQQQRIIALLLFDRWLPAKRSA
ncbi:MAG: hypothetical protein ACUVX8_03835 [Candidatus Zipacnadales bacterium]